jgi:hypothetical protein
MNWSKRIRQIHRWLAMAFTMAVVLVTIVVVRVVALGLEEPVVWVYLLPLLPLGLLLLTGHYLFVLPHAVRWRRRRQNQTWEMETR